MRATFLLKHTFLFVCDVGYDGSAFSSLLEKGYMFDALHRIAYTKKVTTFLSLRAGLWLSSSWT
jgi:hypothetical protein